MRVHTAPQTTKLSGLDGIRGLAALFVVLHHVWLLAFPGFPVNADAPGWSGWLRYGHLAVVVFIVLSGFSLAVSPARRDWRIGSLKEFAVRRAWRILPPYWAALAFSLIVAWTVVTQPGQEAPTWKSVLYFGLLVQDLFGSPTPNGAFWSIAVEAQLYLLFPLMILILRRLGAAALLAVTTLIVALVGALAPHVPAVELFMRLTPQFAALFALGAVCAGIVRTTEANRLPWAWLALLAAAPVITLIVLAGPEWAVANYFWVDLAIGPATGLLLVAVTTGKPKPLVRLLDSRPLRRLGSFSYSLYLIHSPIVMMISQVITDFFALLAVAVPVSLCAAWAFAALFELPFQRHRSWKGLRGAVQTRFGRTADQLSGS